MKTNKRKTLADLQAEQGENPEELEGAETPTPEEEGAAPSSETPETPEEGSTEQEASASQAGANPQAGMVSISATELSALRADAAEWQQKKGKFEVLNTWYSNMAKAGVTHESDASDNKPSTKRQSKGNARAIAIAERVGA